MKEISHVEDMVWVHFRQTNPIFLSQINAGAKDMEDADAEFIDENGGGPGVRVKRGKRETRKR
jgi:hypothetical protein